MYIDGPNRFPASYGQEIIVFGGIAKNFRPKVIDMIWLPDEYRWEIILLWENGEESRVFSSDRGTRWLPASEYKPVLLH